MRLRLLILAAAGPLLASDEGKGTRPMDDRERIQGTWRLVSAERHGRALPDDAVKEVRLVFAGDRLTTRSRGRATEARFTLLPDTEPKRIDLDMDGAVGLGIYRLEGDDLRIAHGEVGDPRPAGFATGEGAPPTVLVLKREGP